VQNFLCVLALCFWSQQQAPPADSLLAQGKRISIPRHIPQNQYLWLDKDTLLLSGYQHTYPHRKQISLFNIKTQQVKRVQSDAISQIGDFSSISISPNRTKLALATGKTVAVIDLASGKLIRSWRFLKNVAWLNPRRPTWYPDNQRVVVSCKPTPTSITLHLFHIQNKKELRSVSLRKYWNSTKHGAIFSARILGVLGNKQLLCLKGVAHWDFIEYYGTQFTIDMESPQRIQVHTPDIPNDWELICVALSDKKRLVWLVGDWSRISSGSDYVLVSDIEMKKFEEIGTIPKTNQELPWHEDLQWNPDGKHFSLRWGGSIWLIPIDKGN
jgi:hypothetical protein